MAQVPTETLKQALLDMYHIIEKAEGAMKALNLRDAHTRQVISIVIELIEAKLKVFRIQIAHAPPEALDLLSILEGDVLPRLRGLLNEYEKPTAGFENAIGSLVRTLTRWVTGAKQTTMKRGLTGIFLVCHVSYALYLSQSTIQTPWIGYVLSLIAYGLGTSGVYLWKEHSVRAFFPLALLGQAVVCSALALIPGIMNYIGVDNLALGAFSSILALAPFTYSLFQESYDNNSALETYGRPITT
jgi:hypothetical protein